MPGKKRKADTKMWGSPASSSSSSRRKAGGGSSSRRGPGSGASAYAGGAGNMSGINESKAEKIFDDLCEEDNPNAADMDGTYVVIVYITIILWSSYHMA